MSTKNIRIRNKDKKSRSSVSVIVWRKYDLVCLMFHSSNFSIGFDLTRKKWRGLLDFLRKSKTKKYHSANSGYSGYDLQSGRITEFGFKQATLENIEKLKEKDYLNWRHYKNEIKNMKKTNLFESVCITYGKSSTYSYSPTIVFKRNDFIKFRAGCLTVSNFIKGKAFPGASIRF